MQKIDGLFAALLGEQRPNFGNPGRIGHEANADLGLVLGGSNVKLLSFTPACYAQFCEHLTPHRRSMPESVSRRLLEPAAVPTATGRKVSLHARAAATMQQGRIFLPLQTMVDVWEWLHAGKAGSRGGSVRNALQRTLFPAEATPPPTPIPSPPPAAPPTQPELAPAATEASGEDLPISEQLADLGLEAIFERFDTEEVLLSDIPRPKYITDLAADGDDPDTLLAWPDDEGPGSIWIIKDREGYRAALLGPKIALAYERRVTISAQGFRLRSLTLTALRTGRDLRSLLHRNGGIGDGYLLVTTHGDRAVAAVVDIERLARLLGFIHPEA